jgi:hypothetical protein
LDFVRAQETVDDMTPPSQQPSAPASASLKRAANVGEPVKSQGKRRVSMSVINFWLDATILITLLLIGWESATLQFLFPAPTMAAGWTLFGLTYDQCRDVQFATICVFGFGILVHVMMHWNWICSVVAAQILHTKSRADEGKQTIYGVATLIVLLHLIGIGVVLAMFFIHRPPTV